MSSFNRSRPPAVKVLAGGLLIVSTAIDASIWQSIMIRTDARRKSRSWGLPLHVKLDDSREVLGARASRAEHLIELLRDRAEHDRLFGVFRRIERESKVLEHQIRAESAGVPACGLRFSPPRRASRAAAPA